MVVVAELEHKPSCYFVLTHRIRRLYYFRATINFFMRETVTRLLYKSTIHRYVHCYAGNYYTSALIERIKVDNLMITFFLNTSLQIYKYPSILLLICGDFIFLRIRIGKFCY